MIPDVLAKSLSELLQNAVERLPFRMITLLRVLVGAAGALLLVAATLHYGWPPLALGCAPVLLWVLTATTRGIAAVPGPVYWVACAITTAFLVPVLAGFDNGQDVPLQRGYVIGISVSVLLLMGLARLLELEDRRARLRVWHRDVHLPAWQAAGDPGGGARSWRELPEDVVSSHPLGEVRLVLLKLVAATALLAAADGSEHSSLTVLTALAALLWRERATALIAGGGALLTAAWGFELSLDWLLTAGSGLLAAWQWWEASRLPLWPRALYRRFRREGYARVPAFRVDADASVELIEPDVSARRNS
ncbi:hypothetical protein AB0G02_09025 [Actinosynnema sp. NPDC023658]|uniref:hypothetical protein n=1 Tax=Actinosynnema sp. NPDC023658 TaxID=3155465 RepID=UPI0033D17E5E